MSDHLHTSAPRVGALDRWCTRVTVTVAAGLSLLPFVSALIAWRGGWMPTSDWASIVIRSYDTFSADPPLIGIYSSATTSAGATRNVYHPGPLQEWLLAGPIHLFAPSTVGILLGSALLVSICIITVLVIAWRRGGRSSLLVGLVALSLFVVGTGPAMLREPLHTWMATYAMLAFLACAWAILDGDRWCWPVAVFFGSLAGQAQVAFLVPALVVGAVVGAVRITTWFRRRPTSVGRRDGHWATRPVPLVTTLVVIACWAAPLYDQFFRSGNLWALFTTGSDGTAIGPVWALRDLAKTLAIPPSWIDFHQHLSVTVVGGDQVVWHTSATEWVTAAVVLGIAVWGLWSALHHGRRTLAALGGVAAASLVGCFAAASVMPNDPFSLLGHREIWRSAGMVTAWFVVLVIGDAVVRFVPPVRHAFRRMGPRLGTSVGAAIVIVVFAATTLHASPTRTAGSSGYGIVEAFTAVASPRCEDGPVVVKPATLPDAPTALGLIAMLTLRGCQVHAENLESILPGRRHRADGTEPTTFTIDEFPIVPDGCRLAASYDPAHPSTRYRDYTTKGDRAPYGEPRYLIACS